jgi:hypothetical protein
MPVTLEDFTRRVNSHSQRSVRDAVTVAEGAIRACKQDEGDAVVATLGASMILIAASPDADEIFAAAIYAIQLARDSVAARRAAAPAIPVRGEPS